MTLDELIHALEQLDPEKVVPFGVRRLQTGLGSLLGFGSAFAKVLRGGDTHEH